MEKPGNKFSDSFQTLAINLLQIKTRKSLKMPFKEKMKFVASPLELPFCFINMLSRQISALKNLRIVDKERL